jgi:chromosome segregation ATPase
MRDELEMLRADFNDCNAERARWKARAEAAEAALAEARLTNYGQSQTIDHWKARAEAAEAEVARMVAVCDSYATENQQFHDRFTAAEATIADITDKYIGKMEKLERQLREMGEALRAAEKHVKRNYNASGGWWNDPLVHELVTKHIEPALASQPDTKRG